MVITLDPKLESALRESARRRGVALEAFVINVLRERVLAPPVAPVPQDNWERPLLGAATDCGVSLPASTLTSEGMYE